MNVLSFSVIPSQVFDIGKGELCPITGLEFGKVNSTGPHIVLVTTARRLYTFHEDLRTLDESYPYLHVSIKYLCQNA